MTDLYISYGLRETLWVSKLVKVLQAEGYTICWEHAVAPGGGVRTEESIQALNKAKCAIAIWSDTSVDDHWLLSDAARAFQQDKLISVVAKSTTVPIMYRRNEPVFMQKWDGETKNAEFFGKLLKSISGLVMPSQASQFERDQEKLARQQRMKAEAEKRNKDKKEREGRAKLRRESVEL